MPAWFGGMGSARLLHLVPICCDGTCDLVALLARELGDVFDMDVEQHPPAFDPELAYDFSRRQYHSRILLAQLLHNNLKSADRVLGVAGVDLFIPVLPYLFGEAQLEGPAAVVSSYRFDNRLYGHSPDRNLLFERLRKEAIHELGHTHHLMHCHHHPCVMMSSLFVEDIDLKSDRFCIDCQQSLLRFEQGRTGEVIPSCPAADF